MINQNCETRGQEASEPTDRRPRHAMGCGPSGLIHIQQVRSVRANAPATTATAGSSSVDGICVNIDEILCEQGSDNHDPSLSWRHSRLARR